ncbi:MAG TPA: hypothetical protein VF244_02455 [Acidimicrobiales bacterium]
MLTKLRRLAIARGLGKSNTWLAVGVTAWVLERLKGRGKKQAKVVYREQLKPGQRILISHLPPDA